MAEVILEALRPEHAEEMFQGLSDVSCYRFIPDEPPVSVDWLRQRYARLALGGPEGGTEKWFNWIIKRQADGKALGYTQATVRGDTALIAYLVFPAQWRQGVATSAVRHMLERLFGSMGVVSASALVDARNRASRALLERLGFTLVREIKNADYFKGSQSDEWEFVIQCWPGSKDLKCFDSFNPCF